MDVVHAGADPEGIADGIEIVEDLHMRAGRLHRGDIGIQGRDRADDLPEFGVAQVGVDLRVVAHTGGRQAERADRPVQIPLLSIAAQRQQFAQGRLVDLDQADPRRLQIHRLVANRQGHLSRGIRERLVVADERPGQDRDRTGQHALDRLVGERLRIGDPVHRHGGGADHVAVQDGRPHAPGAVGLHPAVVGRGEAVELLGEVLNHVVALGLTVYQHIQAQ